MSEMQTIQSDAVLTLLRRLPLRERLRVIVQVLPEVERELNSTALSAASTFTESRAQAAAEAALEQDLLTMGLLTKIPTPLSPTEQKLTEPIIVPGTPLSEIIIAERR